MKVIRKPARSDENWDPANPKASSSSAPFRIYNIGNNSMIDLETYVNLLEKELGKKTKRELHPMQLGDVECTYADVNDLLRTLGISRLLQLNQVSKSLLRGIRVIT